MTTTEAATEVPPDERPAFSVFPGTPVGEALRRHWLPVLPLDILNRQHARRVRLLGEDLVCYRDRLGRYGLIGDRCPHRGVSLEWGVAADVGLRCPYHGWCFDNTGHCVDIPLEGLITRDYVQIRAHPLTEHGGMLWAFLGEGEPPVFPELGALGDPKILRHLRFSVVEANWLEVLEARFAGAGALPATASPYAFLDAPATSVEVMVTPLDDVSTLLVAGDRLGALPSGLVVTTPASDLSAGGVDAPPDAAVSPAAERPGPLARSWLSATLGIAADTAAAAAAPTAGSVDFLPEADAAEAAGPLRDFAAVLAALPAAVSGQPDPRIAEALCARLGGEGAAPRWWALDLLVRTHLPLWLEAAGAEDAAAALRDSSPIDGEGPAAEALGSIAEAEKAASAAFDNAFSDTQREPWKLAWPYVWNAESSARWARGRDRTVAAAWRGAWSTASAALQAGGTVALAAAFGSSGAGGVLAAHALGACELTARALAWPSSWTARWAETVAEVREAPPETPEGPPPSEVLAAVTASLVAATGVALAG
ncbi:MAG TPA: Rieske 2Fe-2S domain-containing protein [Acidimicrobiales bacterium]|nr:Rieske 2Fe-2S domain-containing protein [Acidimicrobiales bacterium]